MKFLVVGFGGMGCRHTQSLVNSYNDCKVYVIEPSDEVFKKNYDLIKGYNYNLVRIENIHNLDDKIDFCVIATSAEPRYNLLDNLLNHDIKNYLIEKVVFQSDSQFNSIINKTKDREVSIYVNFVNRYFENYIKIKNDIKKSYKISMEVIGGDFGLACNVLHYVDLFEYLTNRKLNLLNSKLSKNTKINKRGKNYREILGQFYYKTSIDDTLKISSVEQRIGGNELLIKYNDTTHILNEETLDHIIFDKSGNIFTKDFKISYTSQLTSKIFKDILDEKCLLPKLEDVRSYHSDLFRSVNKVFNLKSKDLCPIT